MAADDLGRRDSYDSRIESGNEDYEIDDFVVDDDSSDEVSEAGSEITITQGIVDGRRGASSSSSYFSSSTSSSSASESDEQAVVATKQSRKDSTTSRGLASSGLFVTDDDEGYGASLGPDDEVVFKLVDGDVDSADVAEEIADAVLCFSRRCNRHCEPLRLDLTSEMFGEDEVADAMYLAVKQGVGMYEKVGSSRVLCTVGPKK